ncbi:cation:proton antiporter [Horticoccus luteus]|uniref:Cation:proton antiporter n=1 Tax=Horticoccus luteus TaxID=2862869 RepID=A0A8F9TX87_9BACT|nr:cation:proton antiporter [Horticoccus luteus]QYM79217.1 cation:proton antiporter [Horticoccus luteus]
MVALLVFGVTLLAAVLISELADRTIVSTAVLFLLAGVAVGGGGFGLIRLEPDSPVVGHLANYALVAVLFTDGMKLGWGRLRSAWVLPGRALLLGLPLTMLATALLAHFVAGLSWLDAWLVGAVLCPTDPVFAAAIVGREGVSRRLRHLLNVESGLNDGLALPIVLGILAVGGVAERSLGLHVVELAGGCALGVAVAGGALWVARLRFFGIARSHEPFLLVAIGLMVFALAPLVHANPFLAAFSAGVTIATMRPEETEENNAFAEQTAELLKLGAVLVFGALITPQLLHAVPWTGYVFAVLSLVVARPIALGLALVGGKLTGREKVAAMWFGPKGFASVIYGLMVLNSGVAGAVRSFNLVAIVVAGSILAHSSTDVVVARWLEPKAKAT